MKTKLIFALCISIVCMCFAGCENDKDNLSVSVDNTVTTTEILTESIPEETAGITQKAAVTTNAAVETTVPETTTEPQTNVSETAVQTEVTSESENAAGAPAAEGTNQSGNEQVAENLEPASPSGQGSFDEGDFIFTYNGYSVTLGESIDGFTDNVSPDSHISSPSCLGNGEDHVYTYSSFEIYAYKTSSGVIVTGIDLTSGDAVTAKNIRVNSSVDELISAYGDGYSKEGSEYVYLIGDRSIRFKVSGEKVTCISYNYDL